jgi:hypothetical protein
MVSVSGVLWHCRRLIDPLPQSVPRRTTRGHGYDCGPKLPPHSEPGKGRAESGGITLDNFAPYSWYGARALPSLWRVEGGAVNPDVHTHVAGQERCLGLTVADQNRRAFGIMRALAVGGCTAGTMVVFSRCLAAWGPETEGASCCRRRSYLSDRSESS